MKTISFLGVEELVAIHDRMIAEYGGSEGLRDHGLLDSAGAMPQASFGGQYLHDGLPAMAAAYLFHLCKNHPFVDGNKRVALASSITFLLLNDAQLTCNESQAEQLTLGVADSSISKDEATDFFRKHVRTATSQPSSRRAPTKRVSTKRTRRKPK